MVVLLLHLRIMEKYNTAAVHMNDGKIHMFAYGTFTSGNKQRTGAIDLGISSYAPENRVEKLTLYYHRQTMVSRFLIWTEMLDILKQELLQKCC